MGNNGCKTGGVESIERGCQLSSFVADYCHRHAHPVNAVLHLVGVPAAFAGFFYFFSGRDRLKGGGLIFLGYLLQYLGHRAQGNEVGEVTLARSVYRRVKKLAGK